MEKIKPLLAFKDIIYLRKRKKFHWYSSSTLLLIILLLSGVASTLLFNLPPIKMMVITTIILIILFLFGDYENIEREKNFSQLYEGLMLSNKIAEGIVSTMDLSKLLELILHGVKDMTPDSERVFLFLVEKERNKEMIRGKMAIGGEVEPVYSLLFPMDKSIGIIPRVIVTKEPYDVRDSETDYYCDQQLVKTLNLNAFTVVPIVVHNKALGALLIENSRKFNPRSNTEITTLTYFANQAGIAIENAKLYEEVENLAIIDGLTELYNHRYFQQVLTNEIEKIKRYGGGLSLMLFDIDNFKVYNDTNGHPAGDEVLKTIGDIAKDTSRSTDIPARYGGEEFAIILLETDEPGAVAKAENLRRMVEEHVFEFGKNQPGGKVTISIGVASYPKHGPEKKDLISMADDALYRAKESGKNRVIVASS